MRYMMMVLGDAEYEAGKQASEELQARMAEYIGEMAAKGIFIDGAGLLPSRHGFRATLKGGEVTMVDGPFTESKEIVGGYAIVEVESEEQAREITREFLALHNDTGVAEGTCIIRRMEDMPAA